MPDVLTRRRDALATDEFEALLGRRVSDGAVLEVTDEYGTLTVRCTPEGYVEVATLCREDPALAFDLFDCLFGVDAREDGFTVIAVLYSTQTGMRVLLKTLCPGGREAPTCPTLTSLWVGANWHERETWDMFGIEFEGHPGLAPRILCVENFEGWPLRKDFYLASREAKPWPGVKEPAELDEEGNVIERVPGPGDAPGPTALDEAMAEQAKRANPVAAAEPATAEGAKAREAAAEADTAEDSGAVVSGPVERATELAQEETSEDLREEAASRAEGQRQAAADARARKAEERAATEDSADDDAPSIPEGRPDEEGGA